MIRGKSLSVVVPVYNEAEVIEIFLRKLIAVLEKSITPYRIIIVSDGSTDNTAAIVKKIISRNNKIMLLENQENKGQEAAILEGLREAKTEAALVMDADFQDPPELIPKMIKEWTLGHDVVFAKRTERKDRFIKKSLAYLYYRLLKVFFPKVQPDVGDFYLLSKKIVQKLDRCPRPVLIRALIPYLAQNPSEVEFVRKKRKKGSSHYSFFRSLKLGLLGFSLRKELKSFEK